MVDNVCHGPDSDTITVTDDIYPFLYMIILSVINLVKSIIYLRKTISWS